MRNILKKLNNIQAVKSNKQINILIVDDNNYIRSLATSLLKKQDYNVISASDAFEAIELIKYYGITDLSLLTFFVKPFDRKIQRIGTYL